MRHPHPLFAAAHYDMMHFLTFSFSVTKENNKSERKSERKKQRAESILLEKLRERAKKVSMVNRKQRWSWDCSFFYWSSLWSVKLNTQHHYNPPNLITAPPKHIFHSSLLFSNNKMFRNRSAWLVHWLCVHQSSGHRIPLKFAITCSCMRVANLQTPQSNSSLTMPHSSLGNSGCALNGNHIVQVCGEQAELLVLKWCVQLLLT